jgi:hypothetical protein
MTAVLAVDFEIVDMSAEDDIIRADVFRAAYAAEGCFESIIALFDRLFRFENNISVGLNVDDASGDVEGQLLGQSHGRVSAVNFIFVESHSRVPIGLRSGFDGVDSDHPDPILEHRVEVDRFSRRGISLSDHLGDFLDSNRDDIVDPEDACRDGRLVGVRGLQTRWNEEIAASHTSRPHNVGRPTAEGEADIGKAVANVRVGRAPRSPRC